MKGKRRCLHPRAIDVAVSSVVLLWDLKLDAAAAEYRAADPWFAAAGQSSRPQEAASGGVEEIERGEGCEEAAAVKGMAARVMCMQQHQQQHNRPGAPRFPRDAFRLCAAPAVCSPSPFLHYVL